MPISYTSGLPLKKMTNGVAPWSDHINQNLDTIDGALKSLSDRLDVLEAPPEGGETLVTSELVTFSQLGSHVLSAAPNGVVAGSIPLLSINGVVMDPTRFAVQQDSSVNKKIQLLPYLVGGDFTSVGTTALASSGGSKVLAMTGDSLASSGAIALVQSSSILNSSYPPYSALDNNDGSFWASASGVSASNPQWWQVNFETPITFARITIRARSGSYSYQAPKNFEIRASDDGMNTYDVLYTGTGIVWSASQLKTFDVNAARKPYTSVRIHTTLTNSTSDPIVAIPEVDFYDVVDGVQGSSILSTFTSNAKKIYVAQSVSASSINGSGYQAYYAADKNRDTRWASASGVSVSNPQWWQITLPAAVVFDRVVMKAPNPYNYQCPKNFEIRASNDDMQTFVTLYTGTNVVWSASEIKSFAVNADRAPYKTVRLHVTANNNAGDPVVSITDFDLVDSQQQYPAASFDPNLTGALASIKSAGEYSQTGTGDFTVEAWICLNHVVNNDFTTIATTRLADGGYTNAFTLAIRPSGALCVYTNAYAVESVEGVLVPGSGWRHVAFCRSSGIMRIFLDGAQVATGSLTNNFYSYTLSIGGENNGIYSFRGAIRNFRITKAARYTSGFTPPPVSVDLEGAREADSFNSSTPLCASLASLASGKFKWSAQGQLVPASPYTALVTYRAAN